MIPTRRLLLLIGLLVLPLLLSSQFRLVADIAMLVNLVVILLACIDLLISPGPQQVEITRDISEVLSLGASNPAVLHLRNRSGQTLTVSVHEDPGPMCVTERLPQTVQLPPEKTVEVHYVVRPIRRGASELPGVYLRYLTRLGLWTRHQMHPMPTRIRIYPDIRAVYRYELMARQNRLAEIGVRMLRMPGQGREFERLREFRYGDEVRQIDWKATARHQQLISREFNVERNQNLVIMVDCGRFMRHETDGITNLDRALNSAIMLSYIALGQGDNVSLMAFSNVIERFIRPVRGKPGVQSLLRSTYDIQASEHAADYNLALEYLSMMQRKRALVILITAVTDELQLRVIGESLKLTSMPYLSMCVLLQDVGLLQLAGRVPASDPQAFHTAAAAEILTGQAREVAALRREGILMVESPPDMLSERMINEYLSIKMRGMM